MDPGTHGAAGCELIGEVVYGVRVGDNHEYRREHGEHDFHGGCLCEGYGERDSRSVDEWMMRLE